MSRSDRRARRSRRRARAIGVAVAVGVGVVAVGAFVVLPGDGSDGDPAVVRAPERGPSSTTTTITIAPVTTPPAPEPAPTTAAAAGPPYAVDVVDTTVVDPTRPTAARGPTPAASSRTLPVRVYVPRAPGRFPLVVFAHGYDIAAVDYTALAHGLAGQGFVVVAPDFPLSSTVFPGPPTQADIDNQARDVAFLVDTFVDDRVPGVWSEKVAPGEAGVVGHSDGGNTAARVASNSCCIASRIGAAAVLSGDEGTSGGDWGVDGSAPMLFVQGTADTINPWSFSQRLYDDAASPKTIVAIDGGDHLAPYVAAPERIVALVAAFLRGHLAADSAALAQVADLAKRDGLRLVASS